VQHLHRSYQVLLWAIVLSGLTLLAWQDAPALSITVAVSPEVASSGETLTLTFSVANSGDRDLDNVVVRVPLPEGTAFERAPAPSETWTSGEPAADGAIVYRAQGPLSPGERADLILLLRVQATSGTAIVLTGYTATAQQLASPVEGAPVTVWVDVTPTPAAETTATSTPQATTTPQSSPSPTVTAQPSPTVSPSPTARPSPTASPTPSPTPTITVVAGELPPTPAPTPNLSSEQERIGTVTVLAFLGLVLGVVVAAAIWVVRSWRGGGPDEEE
jgi:uncharacterized repeat protein (TIGR01451 family)